MRNFFKSDLDWFMVISLATAIAYLAWLWISNPVAIAGEATNGSPSSIGELLGSLDHDAGAPVEGADASVYPRHTPLSDVTFDRVVDHEAERLGIDRSMARECARRLVYAIMVIESERNPKAVNTSSGAMSLFQFKSESAKTASRRMANYWRARDWGAIPSWSVRLQDDPKEIMTLGYWPQRTLALVNLIEQKGSDPYLAHALRCNGQMARELYYRFHHTDPDTATEKRTETILARMFN